MKPGAIEACNGYDDDCDGAVDETGSTGTSTYYLDADADTFGTSKISVVACAAPVGYVANSTDCNDLSAIAHLGATETCNGADDDCINGVPAAEADGDADGFRGCAGDCNDASATIHPGAVETCNLKDDDCNTFVDDNAVDAPQWFVDADVDGFGLTPSVSAPAKTACAKPTGYAAIAGDCDDTKVAVSPALPEMCATTYDDDCDGSVNEADAQDAKAWYLDADTDLHGAPGNFALACTQPTGRVAPGDDCNDANNKVYAGAAEVWYDGIDENCDGRSDYDQDLDGLISNVYGGTDCDDTKSSIGVCTGGTQATAGRTCQTVRATNPTLATGLYWIDPDNDGNKTNAFQVYCDMTTAGGGWTRVFYEDTSSSVFFAANEFDRNKAAPMAPQYAIFSDLELFRQSGKFEFLMRWPGNVTWPLAHQWTQTNNPATDASGALPTGYVSISTPYETNNGWGGLQRSATPASNLIDGTIAPLGNWYYAIGTTSCWGAPGPCQPGPSGGVNIAELYVR